MSLIRFVNAPKLDFEVDIKIIDEHTVQIGGCPRNISGFGVYNKKSNKLIGDYSAYTHLYRNIDFEKNVYQYSDDGHIYDPRKDIIVSAKWEDSGDLDGVRPDNIEVALKSSNGNVWTATLTAEDNWSHTFEQLSAINQYSVDGGIIDNYEKTIKGLSVIYTHESFEQAKIDKKNEIDGACSAKISQGIEYNGVWYTGDCKQELELANQTGADVEYQGQDLSSADLSIIYTLLKELPIYENKYCELLKYVVDEQETIDDVKAIKYGDELVGSKAIELENYVKEKNKVIELYVSQYTYANAEDLNVTQEALIEIYEMIAMFM